MRCTGYRPCAGTTGETLVAPHTLVIQSAPYQYLPQGLLDGAIFTVKRCPGFTGLRRYDRRGTEGQWHLIRASFRRRPESSDRLAAWI